MPAGHADELSMHWQARSLASHGQLGSQASDGLMDLSWLIRRGQRRTEGDPDVARTFDGRAPDDPSVLDREQTPPALVDMDGDDRD
jgi:hypothetical protein